MKIKFIKQEEYKANKDVVFYLKDEVYEITEKGNFATKWLLKGHEEVKDFKGDVLEDPRVKLVGEVHGLKEEVKAEKVEVKVEEIEEVLEKAEPEVAEVEPEVAEVEKVEDTNVVEEKAEIVEEKPKSKRGRKPKKK